MKGSEINAYTARFNDLAVMFPALVTPEYKKIERYIWGLALQIKGMVIASKPTTYDSAKRIAHQLTSTEIQVGFIAESLESGMNKRKFNGKNQIQSSEERQDVETNYAATTTIPMQPRKYAGKLLWCTQCNRHHLGNCSWCSQCNHQHAGDCYICMKCKKRDTLLVTAAAQQLQQEIKEQTLELAMMEEECVLSVVKLDISRRNVQS
uniref:Retrotransposon gag domain-containing protein n=1 Tax=Lactuca sativa TaxID=4236 RepID=A0A9R1VSU6_LACSA|nr:hypothetical protein LSAT_V11C400201970 [Lactuca sativa]